MVAMWSCRVQRLGSNPGLRIFLIFFNKFSIIKFSTERSRSLLGLASFTAFTRGTTSTGIAWKRTRGQQISAKRQTSRRRSAELHPNFQTARSLTCITLTRTHSGRSMKFHRASTVDQTKMHSTTEFLNQTEWIIGSRWLLKLNQN